VLVPLGVGLFILGPKIVSARPKTVTEFLGLAKQSIPDFMKSKKGTIALRVPDHTGLQKLLPHFTGLFSTSANIGGNPIPRTIEEIDERIVKQIACVVLDKKEKQVTSLPSTIIDCSGNNITVVREGAYPVDELRKKMERVSIHLDYHL